MFKKSRILRACKIWYLRISLIWFQPFFETQNNKHIIDGGKYFSLIETWWLLDYKYNQIGILLPSYYDTLIHKCNLSFNTNLEWWRTNMNLLWEFNLNVKIISTFNTKTVTKEKITFYLFHEIVCMDEVIQFIIERLRKTKTCLKE